MSRSRDAARQARPQRETASRRRGLLHTLQGVTHHLRRFRREEAEAPAKVAELLALPPASRLPHLDQDPYFCTLALADTLSARTQPLAEIDPERAALALAVAHRLEPSHYSAVLVADARARALLAVAEAAVLGGELERAGCALAEAEKCVAQGSGDVLLEGALEETRALTLWASGRAIDALLALGKAERALRDTAPPERLQAVTLRRGFLLAAVGDEPAATNAFESVAESHPCADASALVAAARWALEKLLTPSHGRST